LIAGSVYRRRIEAAPDRVRAAVLQAIEDWGGSAEGDGNALDIALPVVAGLRRGRLRGTLALSSDGSASDAVLTVTETKLEINAPASVVLALAALGGVASVSWPWFPRLLPAVPLGLVLAVGGWLLIASRLRSSGPGEFLAAVALEAARVLGTADRSDSMDS
jgi:hypothetical protein